MKVKDLKKITKRYTNGSLKYIDSEDNTFFEMRDITDKDIEWRCTHGGWYLYTDLQGKYLQGDVKADIKEVYTKDQYMGIFGRNNKYE